jgi:hypothetical protein
MIGAKFIPHDGPFCKMLDPGMQLRQMVTSVTHTLRANDPGKWKGLIHLLWSVSQSRYDFCPRAAELLSQLRTV